MEERDEKEVLERKYQILSSKLAERPNSPFLHDSLADVCLRMGRRDEALSHYKRSVELDPDRDEVIEKIRNEFGPEELKGFEFPKRMGPFWADLRSLSNYPLRGGGRYIIIGGALVFTILNLVPLFGFILTLIFAYPYLMAYMLRIIRSVSKGKEELPDWPEISDYWDSILYPFIQVLICVGICYLPAILFLILGVLPLAIILFILGTTYFPMALIAVALHDSPLAPLNFYILIDSIQKILRDYIMALVAIFIFILIETIFNLLLTGIPIIGPFLFWMATIYFAAVQMFVLGNIYYINRKVLAWF